MPVLGRIFVLLSVCFAASAHVFTSVHRLQRLSSLESALLISARRTGFAPLHAFAASTASERRRDGGSDGYGLRAVNQYRLLRRFSHEWPAWFHRLRMRPKTALVNRFLTEARQLFKKYEDVSELPRETLLYAGYALAILQGLYEHQARLQGALNDAERLEIAGLNLLHDFDPWAAWSSIWWLAEALRTLQRRFPYWSDVARLQRLLRGRPRPRLPPIIIPRLRSIAGKLRKQFRAYESFVEYHEEQQLEMEACRVSHDTPSRLGRHCFYFAGGLGPYAPFQFEVIHPRPLVAVIHRLVTPAVARDIVERAAPTMQVSQTVGETGEVRQTLSVRLSESGYLRPESDLSQWLDRRVQAATRLHTDENSAESPSVINYGIGGFYDAHHDYFNETAKPFLENNSFWEEQAGDRIATLLLYLSSPSLGGATAFPYLEAAVKPGVGKALFWYNLDHRTGEAKEETLHTACPVIDGDKWIVNKWIREFRNLGRRVPAPRSGA